MEFTERLSLRPIKWLSKLTYSEFVSKCHSEDKKQKDYESKYSLLQQFCTNHIQNRGLVVRSYVYSTHTPFGMGGRLFSGGSIQGLPRQIRGLLVNGIATDIDMVNAHPVILRYICKLHHIICPYLEHYIQHRDKCLSNFSTREEGKRAYLKATNHEKCNYTIKNPEFREYDYEMKKIQEQLVMIPEYKVLVDSVPVTKLYNVNGSAVNRILCYYENKILQLALKVIKRRGIDVLALMFDGCMIYGDYYEDNSLLKEIEEYVETEMPSIGLQWSYKKIDTELKIPDDFDETLPLQNFVCNDLDAAIKIYSLYPHWKYCKDELYVFDDSTGLWKKDKNTYQSIVSRFTDELWVGIKNKTQFYEGSKVKSYGNTTSLFHQMLEKLKTLCIDDNWLKRTQTSSYGKLLFVNGYYDMKINQFHNEFNPEIVFMGRINHEYSSFNESDEKYMESIKKRLFYEPLGKEVGDFFLLNLARGLAGDVMKRIIFGLGFSNTGKSTISKALLKTCGDYVGTFDGNNFAYRNTSADSASQNRWLMLLKDKRIVFSNEIKSTIPLNGNYIKMVSSGGDCLVGRNHCGNETEFNISFLCVVFANDLPKIVPYDDAVNNRVRVVSYIKEYVENPNEYQLKIDPKIDAEFDTLNFQRCFMELLLRQYWMGVQGTWKEEPVEVLEAKENWIDCEVGCIPSFLQEFEITDDVNDYVLSSDIQLWLDNGKLGITMKKFGMELRHYCLTKRFKCIDVIKKMIKGKSIRVWTGIKLISFVSEN